METARKARGERGPGGPSAMAVMGVVNGMWRQQRFDARSQQSVAPRVPRAACACASDAPRVMDFSGGVEGHHRGHHQWLGERRFPFCAERAKNSAAAARAHRELLAREECSAMGSMDQKPRTIGKKGRIFSDSPSKSGFIKGI